MERMDRAEGIADLNYNRWAHFSVILVIISMTKGTPDRLDLLEYLYNNSGEFRGGA